MSQNSHILYVGGRFLKLFLVSGWKSISEITVCQKWKDAIQNFETVLVPDIMRRIIRAIGC